MNCYQILISIQGLFKYKAYRPYDMKYSYYRRCEMKSIISSMRSIDLFKSRERVVKQVIQEYFKGYFRTFVELQFIDVTAFFIKNKNMLLFEKYREDQMNTYKEFEYGWRDYDIRFNFTQVKVSHNEAFVKLSIDVEYHYKYIETVDSSLNHICCSVKLRRSRMKWRIYDMKLDFDEFEVFDRQVKQRENHGISTNQAIFEVCIVRSQGRKKIKEAVERYKNELAQNRISTAEFFQRGNYNYEIGRAYATRFAEAPIPTRFFYTAKGADCTNFVSQCVWAAYGGYDINSDDVTKANINNKVKMVPNIWYANAYGGTLSWESVEGFYKYCKDTSKIYGPKAQIYGDIEVYKISPFAILIGDVLQIREGPSGRYRHSVYVTVNNYNGSYNGIMVCQHTTDKKNRSLLDVIQKWGGQNCYIRGFRFM